MDDLISRKDAIRIVDSIDTWQAGWRGDAIESLKALPHAQPEITPDGTLTVSIDADIANVNRILLSQTGTQRGGLYCKDEQPEIIRCRDCKYAEVADAEDTQDGYTCQFHRGSIWFSGSYCSWAERRTDESLHSK